MLSARRCDDGSCTLGSARIGEQVGHLRALASIPAVDAVLRLPTAAAAVDAYGRERMTAAIRAVLDDARSQARAGHPAPSAEDVLTAAVRHLDASAAADLTRVVNATGVVLHTNLGRAPLSAVARRAAEAAAGYATVEYDLATGARGSRTAHVGELTAELCGTDAATVVNNGAAALLLVLAAVAQGGEVVVSRGELIEIGGSFRLPDVMQVSGARLREVGTTNRTRLADYREAIGPDTRLLLKAHRSNFRMVGFTQDVGVAELAALAAETGVPFAYDVGSGLIRDAGDGPLAALADEPSVHGAVEAGADLVVFSGDKLLGGPQAGIVAGRAELVARCARHPLARALRVDKLQRAALEATLRAHLRDPVPRDVPTIAMLAAEVDGLAARAERLVASLRGRMAGCAADDDGDGGGDVEVAVTELAGVVGGGALPGIELPSAGLAISGVDPDALLARLRAGDPPVIARIEADRVLLDFRTVVPEEDAELLERLRESLEDAP
jgi:L-seryl-tRNA(Ser) seleniumtransferase